MYRFEGVGSVSGAATMVCSEETYTQLTGEQDYALVSVVLEKNISETEVSKIRNLSSDYVFADNRAENSDVKVPIGYSGMQHTVFLQLFHSSRY